MKKKILLFSLIIMSILFINVENVKAEEYQVGDLVEVINPSGGESMRFYITDILKVDEDMLYTLTSTEPYIRTMKFTEENLKTGWFDPIVILEHYENVDEKFKYFIDMDKNSLSYENNEEYGVFATTSPPTLCDDFPLNKKVYIEFEDLQEPIYFNCSVLKNDKGKFNNSYAFNTFYPGKGYILSYVEVSENPSYDFVLKTIISDSTNDLVNELNNLNLNNSLSGYLAISIHEKNLSLINKIENNTNYIDVNQTTKNNENIKNPSTSDINIAIIGLVTLITLTGVIVGVKRLKKLSK